MTFPSREFRRKTARRLVGLAVLLGVCAMLIPLPIAPPTQNSSEKDLSEPFPCQNRPCGCQTAAQCWKKCCCFTDTQKVAWAKSNNVKVPDFVLAAAKREKDAPLKTSAASSKTAEASQNHSCCDKKSSVATSAACCDKKQSVAVRNVQSCDAAEHTETTSQSSCKKSASSKWVMAVYAAECQGQGPFAVCHSCSTIPTRPVLTTTSVEKIETVEIESERLTQLPTRPPLPPPKIV